MSFIYFHFPKESENTYIDCEIDIDALEKEYDKYNLSYWDYHYSISSKTTQICYKIDMLGKLFFLIVLGLNS